MFDIKTIELDPAKLQGGVWWTISRTSNGRIEGAPGAGPDDPSVLIVPYGIAYERALEAEQKPYLDRLRRNELPDSERSAIVGRAIARTVFRGLRNLTSASALLVWSEDLATELMTAEPWLCLREFVAMAADSRAAAARDEEDRAAGN